MKPDDRWIDRGSMKPADPKLEAQGLMSFEEGADLALNPCPKCDHGVGFFPRYRPRPFEMLTWKCGACAYKYKSHVKPEGRRGLGEVTPATGGTEKSAGSPPSAPAPTPEAR